MCPCKVFNEICANCGHMCGDHKSGTANCPSYLPHTGWDGTGERFLQNQFFTADPIYRTDSKMATQVGEFHKQMQQPYYTVPGMHESKDRYIKRHGWLQEEVKELEHAIYTNNITEAADAIGDILYIAFGTAWEMGLAPYMQEIFNEIHRSNMTKVDPVTGGPLYREDGKVMKPPTYTKPDISAILVKYMGTTQSGHPAPVATITNQ